MEANDLASRITEILDDRKGKDIIVIDTRRKTVITDFFVICSGTSTTHVRALADELSRKLKEEGKEYSHIEGYDSANWILIDYLDVVVHVFLEEQREFYNLERLWKEGLKPSMETKDIDG